MRYAVIQGLGIFTVVMSTLAHGVSPAKNDPVAEFVLSARYGPRICALESDSAILDAELKSMGKSGSTDVLEVDYQKTKACMSESGKRLKAALTEVKKSARNNVSLTKAIDELHSASFRSLLAVMPGSSEGKLIYKKRISDSFQELRAMGDKVISISCKDDIDCVLVRSERLSEL